MWLWESEAKDVSSDGAVTVVHGRDRFPIVRSLNLQARNLHCASDQSFWVGLDKKPETFSPPTKSNAYSTVKIEFTMAYLITVYGDGVDILLFFWRKRTTELPSLKEATRHQVDRIISPQGRISISNRDNSTRVCSSHPLQCICPVTPAGNSGNTASSSIRRSTFNA